MPNPPPPATSAGTLRVLYVDDQEFLRLVMLEFLRQMGCAVETACDGLEGWQKFIQTDFDLMITDIEMPNLDGIGLIRRVRESKRPVRIIVHSSALTASHLAELKNLSVDATVPKGAPAAALHDTIKHVARLSS